MPIGGHRHYNHAQECSYVRVRFTSGRVALAAVLRLGVVAGVSETILLLRGVVIAVSRLARSRGLRDQSMAG